MGFSGAFVLFMLAVMFYLLVTENFRPGIILFTIMTVMMVFGIISVNDMIAGFSNQLIQHQGKQN